MRFWGISILLFVLSGCISSQDYTASQAASHLINQCYKLKQPAFIFEGRCADLNGINDNSELCNSIQIAGQGGFPKSWSEYEQIRNSFDESMFDRLAFEKQRTMLAYVDAGTKLYISKLVHHGWGSSGRYWVVRGNLLLDGDYKEVELPSFRYVHFRPFWLNGMEKTVPTLNTSILEKCE